MLIEEIESVQILDSRGRPTVQVVFTLSDGVQVHASAPSGASTGEHEAIERRDGGSAYGGAGVTGVIEDITTRLAPALTGCQWSSIQEFDNTLRTIDGTPSFASIGSNAAVSLSIAAARALAHAEGVSLWRWLAEATGRTPRLPVPHFNVINGGAHAANPLDFQEFMIAPVGAPSFAEAVRWGAEIYAALRAVLVRAGKLTGVGDEGGFAPGIRHPREALDLLVDAIDDAGYVPGLDQVAIAVDPAANGFGSPDGRYTIAGGGVSRQELAELYGELVAAYPIRSLEDPFHEQDLPAWHGLTGSLGARVQIVGDDLFVTSAERIATGARTGLATAALIKPNQTGTVSGTLSALEAAARSGLTAMVSHRSGETADTFIADLAVGSGVGQIKAGAPARGERVAKYNRLVEIETRAPDLPYGLAPAPTGPSVARPARAKPTGEPDELG